MATVTALASKGRHYYDMNIWEESGSGSSSTNTSRIWYNIVLRPKIKGWDWSSSNTINVYVTINGTETYLGKGPSAYDGSSTVKIFGDTAVDIPHNNDGTKTLDFSFRIVDNGTHTPGSVSPTGDSMVLATIPRYFSSTPTLTLKSKTETSLTYTWKTSETCDNITWSGSGTKSTTGLPGTSGTLTITGLTANTSYTHSGTFRRKDSQLTTSSSNYTNSTDDYPYVDPFGLEPTSIILGQTLTQKVNIVNPHSRQTTVFVKKSLNDLDVDAIATVTTTGTSVNITIPTNDLYGEIPRATSGNLYYYCVYSTHTTTAVQGTYQVSGSERPTFPTSNWSYTADLTALTNDNQVVIDNYSTITITVNAPATSDYQADIKNYYATWGNAQPKTFDGTSSETLVRGSGTSLTVLANDWRGLQSTPSSSTKDLTNNRIVYNAPVVDSLTTHRVNGIDTTVLLNATGTMFKDTFGANGVQNAISRVEYYVKAPNSQQWTIGPFSIDLNNCTFDSSTGNWTINNASIHLNGQSGGFPSGTAYNVKLVFYDAQGLLGYGEKTSSIEDGTLGIDRYKDSNGEYHTGHNGLADDNYCDKFHGDIDVEGEIYKNGVLFQGGGGGETLPVGTILEYPVTDDSLVPVGWMICDHRALSRTEYADLFAVIGTTFGAGNGSTTFNIPDKAGLVAVGYKSSDTDFNAIGKTGGVKSVTLTAAQSGLPKHSHGMNGAGGHDHSISGIASRQGGSWNGVVASANTSDRNWSTVSWVGDHTHGIHDAGPNNASEAHTNLQPYNVTNFIIKVTDTTALTAQVMNSYTDSHNNTYSCDYINDHYNGFDGVPYGSIVDYDGDTVPEGYEEVTEGCDIYSTTEVKTDKIWIDNKPIYRKVYKLTGSFSAGYSSSFSISNLNINRATKLEGFAYHPSYGYIDMYFYNGNHSHVHTMNNNTSVSWLVGWDATEVYITIEYTKNS